MSYDARLPASSCMCILALADDMTGALETGAKFSAAAIHTVVSSTPLPVRSVTVAVYDTETRHVSAERARSEVQRFIRSAQVQPRFVYKKTDSTLRGNIAAELQALAELYPDWRIGYAPAYPALGRTVRSGILYVDGIAVDQTEFARDAQNPVSSSSVSAKMCPEIACTIFDGETDADLAEAADTILSCDSMRIAAGPAGLVEMLAARLDVPRGASPALPVVRTCLLLNGSLHPRSAVQMGNAEAPGWQVARPNHALATSPASVAAEDAKLLVERIRAEEPDAVFVIGGDTAFAVVQALGSPPLWPIAEVLPGVPVTRIDAEHVGRKRDLFLITKAGGFGDSDILAQVRAKLSHAA